MANSTFNHEDCLLKHHVRKNGWLPICKERLKTIKTAKRGRRLKYFTFCATGAIDVFMLLKENVLKKSRKDRFDTVYFFELDPENVSKTQNTIPGSIGFPGNFTEIVSFGEDVEDVFSASDPLDYSQSAQDKLDVRERQMKASQRKKFAQHFPFDVINLDLQEYLFKPKDEMPGKLFNAIRQTLEWQKLPLNIGDANAKEYLTGFSFMFTTRVGPANMTDEYKAMLVDCLDDNLARDPPLADLLLARAGHATPSHLLSIDFATFFKIAVPKILLDLIRVTDWVVDPNQGIRVFEFDRIDGNGTYTMLHFVADIRRKDPPSKRRAPGREPSEATIAYAEVVRMLFSQPQEVVTLTTIDAVDLQGHLDQVKKLRGAELADGG